MVGYCERDAYAARCLMARMEDEALERAPIWDDLTTFDARPWRGAVDLVLAGFPCQPWSAAGKRRGLEDERWIWPDIAKIIGECEPGLVFLENVPGLRRAGLREVLSDLAALGFDAEWQDFAASDVGAPHRRQRLFILAHRDGAGCGVIGIGGLLDGEREARRHDADRRDADMGLAQRARRQTAGGPAQHAAAELGAGGRDVADAGGAGREGSERGAEALGSTPELRRPFPPGPSDAAGWTEYIRAGGPQPSIRRGADGLPDRLERLRALGNGVVPLVAALAFRVLAERAGLVRLDALLGGK
jgi:DNA (cytosine-5)-methyltransferase 1